MTTFTIDEQNNITAFASTEEAAATTTTPFDSFSSREQLAELAAAWPSERLLAIWNSLPGVTPAKGVKSADAAIKRIWERIQSLATRTRRSRKRNRRPRVAKRAPRARPRRARRPRRPPPRRTRPKPKRRSPKPPRVRAASRRRWLRCFSGRTGRPSPRSWRRWAGKNTQSAGSWPAR